MVIILSMMITSFLLHYGKEVIKKKRILCYSICLGIDIFTIFLVWSGIYAQITWLPAVLCMKLFTQGGIAGALFVHVMYAAAVSNGSPYRKAVMPIRGEVSIMASILTLGHNLAFGKKYFAMLFAAADDMRRNILLAAICSLLMILIMMPLFITSFPFIRKKMRPSKWKKLQRSAYLFYGLMYIHVMLLNIPEAQEGKWNSRCNVICYTIIFAVYFVKRISKSAIWNCSINNTGRECVKTAITVAATLVIVAGMQCNNEMRMPENPVGYREVSQETATEYEDGNYTGSAIGYNGKLKVEVSVENGKISEIILKSSVEDEPYLNRAMNKMFPAMIEKNTPYVDTVSSATTTSEAFVEAVSNAIAGSGK